jgi:multiple sugar transport system ATP-binding protein
VIGLPPRDRDIAMVFQSYALYPHMTVRENLEFGLRMRKTSKAEINRLVDEAADTLGITPLLDRKPKQLSGGQRQRVAVGRAIVRKPSVFLFDEPLSNLDAKLRVQMRAEITKLQQRLGTTAVYVTHDQVEAMTMGNRIAVMNGGKIQQVGAPLEVYDSPANLFVANFIGTPPMNFIEATVDPDGSLLRAKGYAIPLPASLQRRVAAKKGEAIIAGIRPEHIHEATGNGATVNGTIELVEPIGHNVVVHSRVGEDILVASISTKQIPKIGEPIILGIDTASMHLFDKSSGMRLEA